MTSQEPQDLVVQALLDRIREDPYPSREQMAIIERSLTPEMAREYLDTLLDKVGQDRFPSNELLQRLEQVAKSHQVKESFAAEESQQAERSEEDEDEDPR
jgi:(p)ppGpp synthase/HD superfamily hydrolase